jgi:chromosome segregation ATPase
MDDSKSNNDIENDVQADTCEDEEVVMPCSDDESGQPVSSLHRLESDVDDQRANGSSVEDDLQERNAVIAELNAELEQRHANLKSLHDALKTIGKLVDDTNLAREKAVAQNELLEAEMRKQRQLVADANGEVVTRDKELNELRSMVQDLQAYIDRRKDHWEKLNNDLDDYRNALIGMEEAVKSREADIQEREDEKIALARSVIQLEQQVAELDGRRAERELVNEQLQTMLDERVQQIDKLSTELAQSKATVEPQSSDLERVIQQERARADRLEAAHADAQSALFEANAKAAEFAAESKVFTEEIITLRDALLARNQLIANLEAEISARKKTIALADPDARRIGATGDDDVEAPGELPGPDTVDEDGARQTDQSGGRVTRLMIVMTGGRSIKFPLYKESTTIGRSRGNDIQLRWKYISRNHARIVCGNGGATIEDLGSKNGIYVNNNPVRSFELHDGDRVDIGEVQFEYIDLEEKGAAALQN